MVFPEVSAVCPPQRHFREGFYSFIAWQSDITAWGFLNCKTLLMHGKHKENLPADVLEGIIHVLETTAGGIEGVLPRG